MEFDYIVSRVFGVMRILLCILFITGKYRKDLHQNMQREYGNWLICKQTLDNSITQLRK